MKVKNLIDLIQKVSFLEEKQKRKWLSLIPQMNKDELTELASIITWGQKQKNNMKKEGDLVMSCLTQFVADFNDYTAEQLTKEVKSIQNESEKKADEKEIQSLLEKIKYS